MTFTFRPGVRENVSLLIGLAGASGSGKTYTAFRLASGIAGGKPFAVIDTEAGRAKHYADAFKFDHGDLAPPFRPGAYADAIHAADKAGYPVIVVDSMTHEWAGEGGVLDWQAEEYERLGAREATKLLSWAKPKQGHKAMVQKLLQIRAHLILCEGRSVILDGTWPDAGHRDDARRLAEDVSAVLFQFACTAPLEATVARIRTRTDTTSQVTPEIATALADRDEPAWQGAHRIDTSRPLADSVAESTEICCLAI